MFKFVLTVALFVHTGSAGAPSCATQAEIDGLNTVVQDLMTKLAMSGLVTVDMTTLNVTIPDQNLPSLLDLLCDTADTKQKMVQLETKVKACPDLLLNSPGLQAFTIKGVGFAEMFAVFGDVDNFCDCRTRLPQAWYLNENAQMLKYEDPSAAYTTIAAVNKICEKMLTGMSLNLMSSILSIGGLPDADVCKFPLVSQAGFSAAADRLKLEKLKMLTENHCTNFAAADWTCVTNKAKMAEFKECITMKGNEVGDKSSCGKRECVMDKFDCTDNAKEMYIDAVNVEMSMEIKDMSTVQECNNVADVRVSVLTIAAVLIFLFLLNQE